MLAIFLYLKKNSIKIRLFFEKKNRKNFENNFCNFFIFSKSRLIHQLKDRKLSVKISVNVGYVRSQVARGIRNQGKYILLCTTSEKFIYQNCKQKYTYNLTSYVYPDVKTCFVYTCICKKIGNGIYKKGKRNLC